MCWVYFSHVKFNKKKIYCGKFLYSFMHFLPVKKKKKKLEAMGTATAPWKQLLLSALESNAHLKHSSYFQLVILTDPLLFKLHYRVHIFIHFVAFQATIGTSGRPSNRTVVFRLSLCIFVQSFDQIMKLRS